ncbi:hypothetical protein Asulf_02101 [Archaeoglobus sulfaticallidus PM70-1]|uniref:Uncharacterized protein n=1 Tax=Archaeoglobus sulfaticallidus PM70-1 TaxID=387631 RepID=N0BEL2_9EURY|nr:hypothetical protein [Archaeoglobus sulfaticallidus]AGK62059.1 hypothetical protein Asulf_02101 [Archaeoglobus sulfaticallidus PM70-1]
MENRDVAISAVMVFSAVMLTYKWLSLYDRVDASVIFFAFLLTLSLGALFISMELRMKKIMEEFENTKRAIAVNTGNLEDSFEEILQKYLEVIDDRLEGIERRIYR